MGTHHLPQTSRNGWTSEQWFTALDGREIGTGRTRWVALVTGIHAAGSDHWIQIMSETDPTQGLLLRVSSRTTIDEAMQTLAATSPRELADGPVLDLSRAA